MKCSLTLKPKKWVIPKDEVDTIEFALQDVNGVVWASFDYKSSKADVEYDDDDDFDTAELARAVQETGKFQVVSVG